MDTAILFYDKLKLEAAETPRRGLSSKWVGSTTSSFAKRMNETCGNASSALKVIGRVSCGTVYELPGTDRALKLGSPAHNDVWRDFLAINTAYAAFFVSEFSFKLVRDFF